MMVVWLAWRVRQRCNRGGIYKAWGRMAVGNKSGGGDKNDSHILE